MSSVSLAFRHWWEEWSGNGTSPRCPHLCLNDMQTSCRGVVHGRLTWTLWLPMSRLQGYKMNKLFAARFPLIWRGQSQTLARSFPLAGFQKSAHVAENGLKTSQPRSLLHIKNKKHLTSREVRLFMQLSIRIHELYNCGRFAFCFCNVFNFKHFFNFIFRLY